MKHFILTAIAALSFMPLLAEDSIETYNELSDNYYSIVEDIPVIRNINGGTIIIPEYDASCPEELKAPFSYACKIVEEYMPPCLPLRVKVSCGRLTGSSRDAVSKVSYISKENFGKSMYYRNAPMSTIKGVILGELAYESSVTYLDDIPDLDFLTQKPDIEITYNQQKLNEIYFSLDTVPGEKYDFVSLAIRDLLRGLGISSGYRYNPVTKGLDDPAREKIPFECYIDKKFGNVDSPNEKLYIATSGKFNLDKLSLYAPTTWINGVSLNYFIPQTDCAVSNILSYDFCKGMVIRSLHDKYSSFIFGELLGWKYDFAVSIGGTSTSSAGSTSIIMPYNGTFSLDEDTSLYGIKTEISEQNNVRLKNRSVEGHNEAVDYAESFSPFQNDGERVYPSGVSVSVLKKDGSWDLVFFIEVYIPGMGVTFNMSDCTFHYDIDEYARTVEGYLKARITTKYTGNYNRVELDSKIFVIDYLPQKVKLSYSYVDNVSEIEADELVSMAVPTQKVRLYFGDTEGVNRIVLERLREGLRVPSKISITDIAEIKNGYYDTTIDRNTTFTAVGYNANGYTRGIPIAIKYNPSEAEVASLDFRLKNDKITITSDNDKIDAMDYSINPLLETGAQVVCHGTTDGVVDISSVPTGLYVLTVTNARTGQSETFKFQK